MEVVHLRSWAAGFLLHSGHSACHRRPEQNMSRCWQKAFSAVGMGDSTKQQIHRGGMGGGGAAREVAEKTELYLRALAPASERSLAAPSGSPLGNVDDRRNLAALGKAEWTDLVPQHGCIWQTTRRRFPMGSSSERSPGHAPRGRWDDPPNGA